MAIRLADAPLDGPVGRAAVPCGVTAVIVIVAVVWADPDVEARTVDIESARWRGAADSYCTEDAERRGGLCDRLHRFLLLFSSLEQCRVPYLEPNADRLPLVSHYGTGQDQIG